LRRSTGMAIAVPSSGCVRTTQRTHWRVGPITREKISLRSDVRASPLARRERAKRRIRFGIPVLAEKIRFKR